MQLWIRRRLFGTENTIPLIGKDFRRDTEYATDTQVPLETERSVEGGKSCGEGIRNRGTSYCPWRMKYLLQGR